MIKKVASKGSSVIITPSSEVISDLITPEGLLNICIKKSQWDNLRTGSNSLESYASRVSISKIIVFLAGCEDIPFTRTLLRSPPGDVKPDDIYLCYAEIISILSYRKEAQKGINGFMNFLNKYGGKINNEFSFDCITLFLGLLNNSRFSYIPNRNYTLQLVNGDNNTTKYVPFDSNYLPGIMSPKGLLSECLIASQNTATKSCYSVELRKELAGISKYNHPDIKALLNNEKTNITEPVVTNGLIAYESLLATNDTLTPKTRYHKSNHLRTFINKWAGKIAGKRNLHKLNFKTRFSKNGETKCVPPINIKGITADNKQVDITFNTYLSPSIYTPVGLLTNALLFIKNGVNSYPELKIRQWETLIHFILKHQYPNSPFLNVVNFFSIPLKECSRSKVVLAFGGIETLIKLKRNKDKDKDKESDFNALLELFSLENKTIKDGRTIPELNYQCCFSELPPKKDIKFKVKQKVNGKVTLGDFKWNILPIINLLPNDGVLNVAIRHLAKKSLNTSIFRSEIHIIKVMIEVIFDKFNEPVISLEDHQANSTLRYLLTSSVKQLNQRNVRQGFTRLEKIIKDSHRNDKGKFLNISVGFYLQTRPLFQVA